MGNLKKKAKLQKQRVKWWLPGGGGSGEMMVQTAGYKMNKFWGYSTQHGDCGGQYRITYLKVAKI